MSKYIGRLVNLGIAKESTRGAGAAATYWLPRTVLSHDSKADKMPSSESLGVIEDAADYFVMKQFAEGNVEGEVRDKAFGLFLYGMLGSVSSAVKETTAYNHTFTTSATNNHQSLCFEVDDPDDDMRFNLVMLNELTINLELGEIVKYIANFRSKVHQDTSGLSASYTSENRFLARHATVKIATNRAGLTAASALELKRFSLTVRKNLVDDDKLGSIQMDDILNKQLEVEGEMELNLNDKTTRDLALDVNTYRAMRLDLLNSDITIGATSNPQLVIDMPRVGFYDWNADKSLDEIVKQTIGFKALYDVANSENAIYSAILTNEATSY